MLFYLICFCSAGFPVISQDISVFIKQASRLEAAMNEQAAFLTLQEALKKHPNDIYALSKASELCTRIGGREKNTANRDVWFNTAIVYAKRAVQLSPQSDQANVSLAMILGRLSMTKGKKEKLENAKLIKEHVEIALKTNPSNYLAWHILGRWNYEIGSVTAVERAGAKIFMGGLPEGSIRNAIMYFEKVRTLSPDFLLNYIELAKAYHKNGQERKAIEMLQIAIDLKIKTEDDPQHKADAQRLLQQWS